MNNSFFDRQFWKSFIVAILATTVSIVLTFGVATIANQLKQKKERKMTAMMVLSNIESFCRNMEDNAHALARLDTLATWLLSLPDDQIPQMDQQQ